MKLNLTANGKPQELILAYLEKNASETLIEKINSGVQVEKDGKTLISKKTLDGFMKYAEGEAKKLVKKDARSACVEQTTVYGWAIHYFEEDSIEGTLYNLDGTEYKPAPAPVKKSAIPTYTPPAPKPKPQMSIFDDMLKSDATENPPTMSETDDEETDTDDEDEPEIEAADEEEREPPEAETKIEIPQTEQPPKAQVSPVYGQYLELKKQNPSAVILMRLGDFYEALESDAEQLADELNLTLTGRDFGLDERVPMIGFPYHASDMYLKKISEFHDIVLVDEGETRRIKSRKIIDRETGEVTESEPETNDEEPFSPSTFHKDTMILLYELLDGKMNLQ